MPITLPPISRRRFLAGTAAAAALSLFPRGLFGSTTAPADPHRIALLSDIHIAADTALTIRGAQMSNHLKQACADVLSLDVPPSLALVNGDCAYNHGDAADYQALVELVRPIREVGIPMHLAMGNHDHREHFWSVISQDADRVKKISDRQVLVIETPRANWVMLDSLDKTNSTPGTVGAEQREWLAAELDARSSKPAIVMVHHDPQEKPTTTVSSQPATTRSTVYPRKVTGLTDTKELLDILLPRKQVKALLFGHTHVWSVKQREGMHLINLPAVAYVFNPLQPCGWVDAHVRETGMNIELRCLDRAHKWNGEKHELVWR